MVFVATCRSVHTREQHTGNVMLASEGVVVVEMAVPSDGLTIFRVGHRHVTCNDFVVLLGESHDGILCVIITPSGDEHSVLIIIGEAVVSSIVDREQGLERQAIDELVQVVDDTCIELELTADGLRLTTKVAVGNGVGLVGLCTTGEVLAVEQVERLAQDGQSLRGIGVNHIDGNQRCSVLGEVRTHGRCLTPEVTLVLVLIIEGGTCVGKTLDELVDNEVDITTNTEAVGIVVLCRTEVQEVFTAIVVNVRVEVCTSTTTCNLQRGG